jgi:hypothetical protein
MVNWERRLPPWEWQQTNLDWEKMEDEERVGDRGANGGTKTYMDAKSVTVMQVEKQRDGKVMADDIASRGDEWVTDG